jgi:hypothetical protein
MEDIEQQPPPVPVAGAGQAPNQQSVIKLPSFWTEDPVSWFRLAEGQFALRNVVDPVSRYYHVLSSLPQEAVRLVRHVLHEDTGPASYDNLRTSLLASHSLSNYQKMEKMMKLPPLGDRKPSVMLAEMLEVCPAGESSTAVFAYLFLQRLPREIRVLLSEDDPADMRAITDKADRLIAMHVPQGHDACAAVAGLDQDLDQDLVAATSGAKRRRRCWRAGSLSSRRLRVSVAVFLAAASPRRPPLAPRCASITPGSAKKPGTARKDVPGRKTRQPGRYFGGSPRPPLLRNRQCLQPLLPRRHRFSFFHHAVGLF